MEVVKNKFVISENYISECCLLTHSNKLKNIILLYTNEDDVFLFKHEEKTNSYSTDVYYKNICYKLVFKKQKSSLTYMCYIYFENHVQKEIQKLISKKFCKLIKNINCMRGFENGPSFNKILSSLLDHHYDCKSVDLNTMLDEDQELYNHIKTKLNYKCDLSNEEVNCDLQNMLILRDNTHLYGYGIEDGIGLESNTYFLNSENKGVIPAYCLKYIPELSKLIVEDDCETYIRFNDKKYSIYNGKTYGVGYFINSILFKYCENYIICHE